MQAALPHNETDRLIALRALCQLDTPADPEFDLITELAAKTFDAPVAAISLIDAERQWFKSRVGIDLCETPRDIAFCAHAIHSVEPTVVLDARSDGRFADNPLVTGAPHVRFYAGVPLVNAAGLSYGTLCVIGTEPRGRFTDAEAAVLKYLGALVLARLDTLHTIGYVDALTLLPNRSRFVQDLQGWMADRAGAAQLAAVAIDICEADYFHSMERALGCDYAEGYINAAKRRLLDALPHTSLYRIGPTLFACVRAVPLADDLAAVFDELWQSLAAPVEHLGIPHTSAASTGAVRLDHHGDAADIVRALISAVDSARAQGLGHCSYEPSDDEAQRLAFRMLTALPAALLAHDQLSLHYQPRVALADGKCVGVEALLRWRHPEMGNVAPGVFIPLAEKTALMWRITQWVLNAGFAQAALWQRAGYRFSLSLNVSAHDLDHAGFVDALVALRDKHAVNPALIELEFTESAMSMQPQRLQQQLRQIRALGFQLSIDDFGTGYSNLTYLKRLPASVIKIDQSFVGNVLTDEKDAAIVRAVIALAHELDYTVVAEGIEAPAVLEQLLAWGCDEGQGDHIARPMPLPLLEAWLLWPIGVRTATA